MNKLQKLLMEMIETELFEATFNPMVLTDMPHSDVEGFFPSYIAKNFPNLMKIGEGSSRVVYVINSKKALKVAKNIKGKAQNLEEMEISAKEGKSGLIAKVFSHDKRGGVWVVSELVRPLKGKDEFLELAGFNFSVLTRFFRMKMGLDEFIQLAKAMKIFSPLEERQFLQPETQNFLRQVKDLQESSTLVSGDLVNVAHWGKTADGRVVILDYGATKSVMSQHYNGDKNIQLAKTDIVTDPDSFLKTDNQGPKGNQPI